MTAARNTPDTLRFMWMYVWASSSCTGSYTPSSLARSVRGPAAPAASPAVRTLPRSLLSGFFFSCLAPVFLSTFVSVAACSRVRRPAAAVPRQLLRRFFFFSWRARAPVACRRWRRFSVCRETCAPEGIYTLELAPRAHRCFLRVGFLRFEPAHFVR